MNSIRYLFLLAPLAIFNSCAVFFPYESYLVETPSFDSPELTFQTLRAAIRNDRANLEYQCFSEEFKEKHGISSLTAYSEIRARIPEIKWVGRMQHEEAVYNNDHEAFVRANFWISSDKLLLRMVRRDFVRIRFKNREVFEFYLTDPDSGEHRWVSQHVFINGPLWSVDFRVPPLRELDDVRREDVLSVELISNWKIKDIEVQEGRNKEKRGP